MGKKLGFTSLFLRIRDHATTSITSTSPTSSSSTSSSHCSSYAASNSSSWPWPSCKHPKTQSFRAGDEIFKTVNSVYFDSTESCFTNTSEDLFSESFSTVSEDSNGESLEMVIRGLRSDRLFFEPCSGTSLIMEETSGNEIDLPFKESVAMAMESQDPYRDFRESMEEMVLAHGMKNWESLEELLVWYLKVNGKKTHGFILGAFVDLLVSLASPSPSSSYSSSSLSFEIEELGDD